MSSNNQLRKMLVQAQAGDHGSLQQLVGKFRPVVERALEKFREQLPPDLSCQDLYQEVWLRVWGRLQTFEGVKKSDESLEPTLVNWLKSTTRNVAFNVFEQANAKKRKPKDPILSQVDNIFDEEQSPSSRANGNEEKTLLRLAIGELQDDRATEMLRMKYFDGKTFAEIGAALDVKEDSVRYQIKIILAKLEIVLGKWKSCQ